MDASPEPCCFAFWKQACEMAAYELTPSSSPDGSLTNGARHRPISIKRRKLGVGLSMRQPLPVGLLRCQPPSKPRNDIFVSVL